MTVSDVLTSIKRYGKKWRKIMAKNLTKRGKSARRGNSPAPYTKYQKRPYIYPWAAAKKQAAQKDVRASR